MSAARASVATLLVQVVDMAAQFAVGVFVARGLGPEAMGAFTFTYSVTAVLAITLLFGTAEISIPLYAQGEAPAPLLAASLRRLARGTRWCLGLALVITVLAQPSHDALLALGLGLTALLVNGVASTFNAAILGLGLSGKDLRGALLSRALLLGGAALGVVHGSLPLVMASTVVSALALAAWRGFLLQRDRQLVGQALAALRAGTAGLDATLSRRSAAVGWSGVFGMISARIDMMLLERMTSPQVVGEYGAAYRVINGVGAACNAVVVALYPRLASSRERERRITRKLFVVLPTLGVAVLLVSARFSTELITLIYGPRFAAVGATFRVLLIAAAVQVVLAFLSRMVVAAGREGVMPWAQGVAAVVNVTLNAALIGQHQGFGAAIATLVAESTALTVYLLALRFGRRAPHGVPA